MVSTPVKHMQTEDEILLVLAQAEERSKQIVLLQSRTEFDDEAAMEVADEVLREIDGPTARPTSLVEDTIDHTR